MSDSAVMREARIYRRQALRLARLWTQRRMWPASRNKRHRNDARQPFLVGWED